MELSQTYPHNFSKSDSNWSPNGLLIANVFKNKVMIRIGSSLQIIRDFICDQPPQWLGWSPNSKFIACGNFEQSQVQIFCIELGDWSCRLKHGLQGLSCIFWSPKSENILTMDQFELNICVWSFEERSVLCIKNPKYTFPLGIRFSNDGNSLAVVERINCKDFISIYSTDSWILYSKFEVETFELADLCWSPDDLFICVWDSCLEYRLFIYSTATGACLFHYLPLKEKALGIRTVEWLGHFLAIGSYDQKVRLFSAITFSEVGELIHTSSFNPEETIVYKEYQIEDSEEPFSQIRYRLAKNKLNVPSIKNFIDKPNPKIGISFLKWSYDNFFIATINENLPNVVYIWNVLQLRLISVLIQNQPIKCLEWNPLFSQLAVSTGSNVVYIWTLGGCYCCEIGEVNVKQFKWNPNGKSLVVQDTNKFRVCYMIEDQEEEVLGEEQTEGFLFEEEENLF